MDNSAKFAAYISFHDQGMQKYNAGDIQGARDALLKAAELANDISVHSTSYDVQSDYHKAAARLLDFVRKNCSSSKPTPVTSTKESKSNDEVPEFLPIEDKHPITFKDVAGLEDVKREIRLKVINPLADPHIAEVYKIKPGAKIILYGPPGTGKTYIARAIAGEVDAKFYSINCQDLISKYMGDSSKKLDALFDCAQKNEKAIIFFDEFDSVASKRGEDSGGTDGEMARFVATFLTKVDGFKKSDTCKMLLLIAATNRPWVLDDAMMRGGRFDTQILVTLPDLEARLFMINKALKGIPVAEDLDFTELARKLEGYGGGDVVAICEKAKVSAYGRAIETKVIQKITRDDFKKAISMTHNVTSKEELERYEKYSKEGF